MAGGLVGGRSAPSSGGGGGDIMAPGDISFFEVRINGEDVTNFVMNTQLFMDIFTPFWTCQLLFADGQNLLMNLPITVGSVLTVEAETNAPMPCSGRKLFKYIIHKIENRKMQKQENQTYILHGITQQFFANQKTRVQKSFVNMTPIEIAGQLVAAMGGGLGRTDNDPEKYDLIIPNWSAVPGIEWLCRFAKIPDKKAADFLFWQQDDGVFSFRSLEKMFKDKIGLKLRQMQPNLRSNNHNDDAESFVNMESYEFLESHNSGNKLQAGFYANTILTHDIINKTMEFTKFQMGDDIQEDQQKKNFKGESLTDLYQSHISYTPDHPGMNSGVNPENTHKDWTGSRKTNMMKLEENRILVTMPGAICMWNYLGQTCEVKLPSHQDLVEIDYDEYMKGDYLVMAIKHSIGFGHCKSYLELGKKRLAKSF